MFPFEFSNFLDFLLEDYFLNQPCYEGRRLCTLMEYKYWALLAALLLQNMLLAITVKLSKTIQPPYSSASVVFLNELTKFMVAFYAVMRFGDEEVIFVCLVNFRNCQEMRKKVLREYS